MKRPPPKPCPFCGKVVKFGYPGNDPEIGPAGYHCPEIDCQRATDAVRRASMSAEEKFAEDEEQRRIDEMYGEPEVWLAVQVEHDGEYMGEPVIANGPFYSEGCAHAWASRQIQRDQSLFFTIVKLDDTGDDYAAQPRAT